MTSGRKRKRPPVGPIVHVLEELAAAPFLLATGTGKVIAANKAVSALLRIPRRTLMSTPLADLLDSGELSTTLLRRGARMPLTATRKKLRIRRTGKDPVTCWVRIRRLQDGEILVVLDPVRGRSPTNLRRRDTEFDPINALIESNHEFFGIADLSSTITYINRAGRDMCGLPAEGPLPKLKILDTIPEFFHSRFLNEIVPAVRLNGRWHGQAWLRRFDTNAHLPVEVDVFTVFHPGTRRPGHIATVIRDLSEREKTELALRRHANELTAIHLLSTQVNASLSVDRVIEAAMEGIMAAVQTDRMFLYLREGDRFVLRSKDFDFAADPDERETEFHVAETLCNRAVHQQKSLCINDLRSGKGDPDPDVNDSPIDSFAALLLRRGAHVLGVIGIASYSGCDYESRAPFLETIADTISIGLTNAMLFTSTKEAAESLRKSEERFRTLVEQTSEAIIVQTNARFAYLNDEALRLLGATSADQLIGKPIIDRIHPDYRDFVRQRVAQTDEEKRSVPLSDMVYVRLDGSFVSVESAAAPITFGGAEGSVIFAFDIEGRRASERAVRESEERLNQAQAVAHVGNWALDLRTQAIWGSNEAFRIYGVDRTTGLLTLRIVQQSVLPAYRPAMDRALRLLIEEGTPYEQEYQITRADDGSVRFVYSKAELMRDAEGTPVRVLGVIQDITDRKRTEAEFTESEKRWHAVFDNSGIGIVLIDSAGFPIQCNRAFEQMLGYTEEELRHILFTDLSHPDDAEKDFALASEILDGKREKYQIEKRYFTREGKMLWANLTVSALHQKAGSERLSIGLLEDITERKHTQEALRESEELYRKLISTIPDVIIRTDIQGYIIFINETGFPALGYETNERVLGKNILSFVADRDRERARENMMFMLEKYLGPVEYSLVGDDGALRECEVNGDVLRTVDGEPFGMVFLIRDITERKKNEEALRESEYFLRKSQDVARIGSYYLDATNGQWGSSPVLDDIFGIPSSFSRDIAGWLALIHPDQREEMQQYFSHEIMELHRRFDKTYRIIRNCDGQERWVHGRGELQLDEYGNTTKMIGTIQDVTERTEHELAIVGALREKEILLKEIHHRVKNNMQVISSLLSLQGSTIDDPDTKSMLFESMNRIRSMALVHERLYKENNLASIDFRDYLNSMASELSRSYPRHDITVRVDAESMQVGVDLAIPCGLIANELISNSFKHAFPNGREGSVLVSLRSLPGSRAELRVRDDGIGFAMQTDDHNGETLGLTIINALVDQISGRLSTERRHGTSVAVEFPVS